MDASAILAGIPAGLRTPLVRAFHEIVRNFREGRWEPAELNGGKLCEAAYSILKGHVEGRWPAGPSKPRNMVEACRALEQADADRFPRSVRVQLPRLLAALYEIRNNRGVGHVGGDVDPNHMDARVVLESAKWVVAELVRVFHHVGIAEATQAVEALVERTVPVVWQVGDKRRVLRADLSKRDQVLLLLYSSAGGLPASKLLEWVEYSNASAFRRDLLMRMHRSRLIEYDIRRGEARISPAGIAYVEDELPLTM